MSTTKPIFSRQLLSRVQLANSEWRSLMIEKPLIHKPSGIKIHILGTSLLNIPSAAPSTALLLSQLKPTLITHEHPQEAELWMKEYSDTLLGPNRLAPLGTDEDFSHVQNWMQANTDELLNTGLPMDYIEAAQATGLLPLEEDVTSIEVGRSLGCRIERMQDAELAEAEALANRMAKMRNASKDDEESNEKTTAELAESHANLQNSIRELFKENAVPIEELQKVEHVLADAVLMDLTMGPEMYEKYRMLISKWASNGPQGARYSLFYDLIDAKAQTMVGKVKVSCLRMMADRDKGPVVVVAPRKLVSKIVENWAKK
ncbi:hypothetical protein HDV05_007011 [Chytridiales sp. JEL 0842]|nr:hypothetical protein HDV05_007011 [Chytridiales sp. JEL 0842]